MADKNFVHFGRAANCACRGSEGIHCPDCNHVMIGLEGEDIPCPVCGRHILSPEKIARDREIKLVVQNADVLTGSNFSPN